jgi:hypothetical protein
LPALGQVSKQEIGYSNNKTCDERFERIIIFECKISMRKLAISAEIPHLVIDNLLKYSGDKAADGGLVVRVLATGPTGPTFASSGPAEDGGFL